jgi:peptide/nickel transport system ATP-binding protein
MTGAGHVLEVSDLRTHFFTRDGVVKAVDAVSFHVDRGEVLGLVGESGCGKSVTALSVLGLLSHPGRIVSGAVRLDGTDLIGLSARDLAAIRGDQISMIFQQPTSSLNPVSGPASRSPRSTSSTETWPRRSRGGPSRCCGRSASPTRNRRARGLPHELSGGMAQRVMIAMALACEPDS